MVQKADQQLIQSEAVLKECTERLAGSVLMLAALADRPGFRVPCGRVGPLS